MVSRYQPELSRSLLTTAISSPYKAFDIRRDPHVSLLYSDPTASGLDDPPAVLVQGTATAPGEIVTSLVRGRLAQDDDAWLFYPEEYFSGDAAGPVDMIKKLRQARKAGKRYLEKRGLKRPKIP